MALQSTASLAPLSSKLEITAVNGFALQRSGVPDYRFEWHQHDCAMLLWTQAGALDSHWADPMPANDADGASQSSLRLVRRTALLLPAHAAHSTRADAPRQRHGELYLRTELLKGQRRWGAFRLDDAALAMLDALLAPSLAAAAAEPLLQAVLAQFKAIESVQWLGDNSQSDRQTNLLSQRMMQCFNRALDRELPLPAVEAVSDELGVSMRRLQRACAAEMGDSPVTLRRRLLATRARELLDRGLAPARAAERLGFTHTGHLNRLLRDLPN